MKASLWGEDFAASSDQAKYKGSIDRWFDNKKDTLMVKWEGYTRCQKTPLTSLDTDAAGDSGTAGHCWRGPASIWLVRLLYVEAEHGSSMPTEHLRSRPSR